MIYKLTPEEKSTAKILVTQFVGEVLRRNSNGNFDLETNSTYNLLGNYANGFHNEEMVYREITAQFKNHAATLKGANKARREKLQDNILLSPPVF